jgi:hypothetical protein
LVRSSAICACKSRKCWLGSEGGINGSVYGDGSGSGYGDGDGSGSVYGDGSGYGSGDGSDLKSYSNHLQKQLEIFVRNGASLQFMNKQIIMTNNGHNRHLNGSLMN